MALNYKDLLSDVLLELNKNKKLGKITVTDIQKNSGINRPVLSVAKNIIDGLNRSMTPLFFQNPIDSPLEKTADKIQKIIESNKE